MHFALFMLVQQLLWILGFLVSSSFFHADILGNSTLMQGQTNEGYGKDKWDHKGKLLPVLCPKMGMLLLQMNCSWCNDHFLGAVGWKKIFKNSMFHGNRTTQRKFWLIQIIHRVTLLHSRLFMDFQGIAPVWRYQVLVGTWLCSKRANCQRNGGKGTYLHKQNPQILC